MSKFFCNFAANFERGKTIRQEKDPKNTSNTPQMQPESQHIEYKESWRDEYLKWICGFANAQGGTLYIGVNDDGEIVGVTDAHRLSEDIPNKVRDVLGIMVDVSVLQEDDKEYLAIVVEAQNIPISYKGQYHYRTGSTKQELKGIALHHFILKKMGRTWDDAPRETSIDAIDREAIDYFLTKGIESGRIEEDERKADTKQILENLDLIDEDGKLKNAAFLLFAKDPRKYFSGIEFKMGKFGRNEAELIVQDVVTGNLIQMTDKVIKLLKTYYLKSYIHYEGMQRIETLEIPEVALREMIYNSISHKDYANGIAIQMRIYDDQIELWNDGELPAGYTQETLMRKHSSRPRNKNIATTFFKAGFVEAWGRGYRTICEAMEHVGLPTPTIENDCGGTLVTIKRPLNNPYNDEAASQFGGKEPQNVGKDGGKELTERQQHIYQFIRNSSSYSSTNEPLSEPLNTTYISQHLNIALATLKRDLQVLVEKKLIHREGGRKQGRWVIDIKQ